MSRPVRSRRGVAAADSVRRAQRAVFVAFAGSGFAYASWASRIPQLRDRLNITPGELGFLLLSVAAGSLVGIPLAGRIVARFGEARTIAAATITLAVGLLGVAVGYRLGVPTVVAGLLLIGMGNGVWDVAMNVQGAAVERRLDRSVMSRFHAGWSIGTVAGAGLGSVLVAGQVDVTAHLIAVAVVVGGAVPVSVLRGFLPADPSASDEPSAAAAEQPSTAEQPSAGASGLMEPRARSAWLEPRTLLIGVFVLCMAFTEGTGNDWLSLAVIDGYHTAPALGTVAFAVFLAAMTTGRWFGTGLLDRYGRVPVLRVSVIAAALGLTVVSLGHGYGMALGGAVLWGVGAALGFPTGMSAAADDPRRAAARVSVAASVAYVAFLAGPPIIGFLADRVSVTHALLLTAGLLALAAALAGACAPLPAPGERRSSPADGEITPVVEPARRPM